MQLLHGSNPKRSVVHLQHKAHLWINRRQRANPGPPQAETKGNDMAYIAHAQNTAAATGLRGRLLTAIQRMQENRARRAVYRQTVRELNSLTTRDLDDLGINRSMITRLAHEAAWGASK